MTPVTPPPTYDPPWRRLLAQVVASATALALGIACTWVLWAYLKG